MILDAIGVTEETGESYITIMYKTDNIQEIKSSLKYTHISILS